MNRSARLDESRSTSSGFIRIIFVLLGAVLSTGCAATSGLVCLGVHKEAAKAYHAAYSYRGNLVLSYDTLVSPVAGLQQEEVFTRGKHAERWAEVSENGLREFAFGTSTNSPPFKIHKSTLPESIRKDAAPVPLIQITDWNAVSKAQQSAPIVVYLDTLDYAWRIGIRREDGTPFLTSGIVPTITDTQAWAYPVLFVGLVPALAFDFVTSPIQFIWWVSAFGKSVTG